MRIFQRARLALACVVTLLVGSGLILAETSAPQFKSAKPVWLEGREKEKNLQVGFSASFVAAPRRPVRMLATGATIYRVYLNGAFLAHGPARGPHGHYRVDEWDLTDNLKAGTNVVAFEVAGYNANSYYLLDQPSFLQAEILAGDEVLAATDKGGKSSFRAQVLPERIQRVQRYSFQRPFSEAYRLTPGFDAWRTAIVNTNQAKPTVQEPKGLLPRRVLFPDYNVRMPIGIVAEGKLKAGQKVEKPWKDRSLTAIGPKLGGYPEQELETIPSLELQTLGNERLSKISKEYSINTELVLENGEFKILDFGVNLTGFIGSDITCDKKTRVMISFDEVLSDGDVDFKRLGCVNMVSYELEPGTYRVETLEPYTLRYAKLMVLDGSCKITKAQLREYVSAGVSEAQFAASDERLNRLFAAGRETFRQNSLDIFMDCPSRERAGWLCDSFFTSRVAKDLMGNTTIEKNFLENFQKADSFAHLPEGMLPMCYPADHNDGVFIPNWALWFVVELEEYLDRSGDRALVEALQPRVMKLLQYFERFKNSDGLLEKLESWVFVEWSAANSFVQDVNYPSNMLYARALAAAGKLYGRPDLLAQAEQVRTVIRKQSFDGKFFVDNALRKDGQLFPTTNRTEVCQYFAFFFGIATRESHPELWQTLEKDFGPQRKQTKAHPEVHFANAFIGNVLRLELLANAGLTRQLLDESIAYQLYMVERTGTLWENDHDSASCNHGFASHGGVHLLYRDVLGLQDLSTTAKTIRIRFADSGLTWCEGAIPTPDGPIAIRWRRAEDTLLYELTVPAGYRVTLENQTQLKLKRQN